MPHLPARCLTERAAQDPPAVTTLQGSALFRVATAHVRRGFACGQFQPNRPTGGRTSFEKHEHLRQEQHTTTSTRAPFVLVRSSNNIKYRCTFQIVVVQEQMPQGGELPQLRRHDAGEMVVPQAQRLQRGQAAQLWDDVTYGIPYNRRSRNGPSRRERQTDKTSPACEREGEHRHIP